MLGCKKGVHFGSSCIPVLCTRVPARRTLWELCLSTMKSSNRHLGDRDIHQDELESIATRGWRPSEGERVHWMANKRYHEMAPYSRRERYIRSPTRCSPDGLPTAGSLASDILQNRYIFVRVLCRLRACRHLLHETFLDTERMRVSELLVTLP